MYYKDWPLYVSLIRNFINHVMLIDTEVDLLCRYAICQCVTFVISPRRASIHTTMVINNL